MSSRSERFWARVDRSGGAEACWPWIGCHNGPGYGQVRWDGRQQGAHRIAWEERNGPIPERLLVCHRCDNPPCCNPAHMFLGTVRDNAADMLRKGRAASGEAHGAKFSGDRNGARTKPERHPHGERHPDAKLKESDVLRILTLARNGVPQRVLAAEYGVRPSTISSVVTRTSWKHIHWSLSPESAPESGGKR